jgi:hypothetical protein
MVTLSPYALAALNKAAMVARATVKPTPPWHQEKEPTELQDSKISDLEHEKFYRQ